jgi:hypothetical protein
VSRCESSAPFACAASCQPSRGFSHPRLGLVVRTRIIASSY